MAVKTLDWNKYRKACIDVAAEGIVMLENRENVLPLKKGSRVALFGRMQTHYYKSGTGSGGMVNVPHVNDIREGLMACPGITLDTELMDTYDEWEKTNPLEAGFGWGQEPWSQPEMPVDEEFAGRLSSRNDVAVIIIARTAGEDRDNTADKGAYYLRDSEEELLRVVSSAFDKTVVLLNVGNIIDMAFVAKYDIKSVLYIWQSGMFGGLAVGKVLSGEVSPSGCLPDTIAKTLEAYPSNNNFGNKDKYEDIYEEDIFVGYRYFQTFAPDQVLYPFAAGRSYTTFEYSDISCSYADSEVRVSLKVTNTGSYTGRKVVTLFVKAPDGKLSKPAIVFIGSAKTGELLAGASETVTITAPARYFASFDDDGRAGLGTGLILEEGKYILYIGGNVSEAYEIGSFAIDKTTLLESLTCALAPRKSFMRMIARKAGSGYEIDYEDTPLATEDMLDRRMESVPQEIPQTGDKGIKLADVKCGRATMEDFVAQLTDEDLSLIIRGEGMGSPKVTVGTAAAFGGVSKELKALGIPTLCCTDGPSGLRIDSGKKAFSLPNGTCLASTFDPEAVEELYTFLGLEMLINKIDSLLGPGINIHRHPLNGRNFEYFSEDPVLTGRMAKAQVAALEKSGVTPTIKHLCANNREEKRREMNSVLSSRALREIYLLPFEIAIREGKARSVMSSYNRINGPYSANNYEQNTVILRQQWGFDGIVMTDWWANISKDGKDSSEYDLTSHSVMARSQNDIYMVCANVERSDLLETDCYKALTEGDGERITRAELQRNAANILRFAMNTPAMDRLCGLDTKVEELDNPFKDEDVNVEADVYYDLDDEILIPVTANTRAGKDIVFGISASKPGIYDVEFIGSSELGELAQIPMSVYVQSIPLVVITWNGTNGEEVSHHFTGMMYSRNNVYRVHFGGNGVCVTGIRIKYLRPLDEAQV